MKNVLFILVLFLISSCTPIKKLYVPFSEAKKTHFNENDDTIRIYFDRMGFVYPDITINYEDFKNNDGRLNRFYSNNLDVYNKICKANKVKPTLAFLDTIDPSQEPLQKALIAKQIKKINSQITDRELIFIIHGFNEYPLKARDISSYEAMKETRQVITNKVPNKEILFVEIYWDGLSQEGGSEILSSINSFKIWNNAQASATNSGLELRRILSGLKNEKIIVFTHSHGAGVITTALFNVEKFRTELYNKKDHWLFSIKNKYNNKIYDTPKQKYTIGMLAPAIPGVNVFDEYFQRTVLGTEIATNDKNFKFIVGFNENDPVTRKYGIAAKKLGSTTLACKPRELLRTENLYNNREIIDHIDFSTLSNGNPQKNHSWFSYLKNTSSINAFIFKTLM